MPGAGTDRAAHPTHGMAVLKGLTSVVYFIPSGNQADPAPGHLASPMHAPFVATREDKRSGSQFSPLQHGSVPWNQGSFGLAGRTVCGAMCSPTATPCHSAQLSQHASFINNQRLASVAWRASSLVSLLLVNDAIPAELEHIANGHQDVQHQQREAQGFNL